MKKIKLNPKNDHKEIERMYKEYMKEQAEIEKMYEEWYANKKGDE